MNQLTAAQKRVVEFLRDGFPCVQSRVGRCGKNYTIGYPCDSVEVRASTIFELEKMGLVSVRLGCVDGKNVSIVELAGGGKS